MPYVKNALISRAPAKPYSPMGSLGSFLDTVKNVASGALTFYGEQQKQAGQLEATQAALAQKQAVSAPASGISTTTLVVGGVAAVGLVLLLTKKRG